MQSSRRPTTRRAGRAARFGASLVIVAALLAVACESPTQPGMRATMARGGQAIGQLHAMSASSESNDSTAPGQLVACANRPLEHDTATIGPSGGTLVVGNSRLIVPPGALLTPTLISGTVPDTTVAVIQFEPTGLRFAKPAGLQLDVTGCASTGNDSPAVDYVDDQGVPQERIEAVFSNDWHTVAAPIEHFSGYAFAF